MTEPAGAAPPEPSASSAHCDVRGKVDGPSIVLIPPLGGSGRLFSVFREALSRDHRVVTCEPPGSGASAPPQGLPSTRSLARDVAAALRANGSGRSAVFGISLGGMIAQWLAIDAPDLVAGLVLASTSATGPTALEALKPEAFELATSLFADEPMVELAEKIASDATLDDPAEKNRIDAAARAHPRTRMEIAWLSMAAFGHDAAARLGEIAVPTLVLTGASDTLIDPWHQRELARAIAGAKHEMVPGAGHDLTLDRPEETAAHVRAFIAAIGG